MTSPPIKDNFDNTMDLKPRLKGPEPKGMAMGGNDPALSCSAVKLKYPEAWNGYQFVKNDCAQKPAKVYCDFDGSKMTRSFQITNGHDFKSTQITKYHNLVGSVDFPKICAQYGMVLSAISD